MLGYIIKRKGTAVMAANTADLIAKCRALISNPDKLTEPERLHQLFEIEWDYQMIENPILPTFHGIPGHNHRWPDISLPEISRRKKDWHVWREALQSINAAQGQAAPQPNQLETSPEQLAAALQGGLGELG